VTEFVFLTNRLNRYEMEFLHEMKFTAYHDYDLPRIFRKNGLRLQEHCFI